MTAAQSPHTFLSLQSLSSHLNSVFALCFLTHFSLNLAFVSFSLQRMSVRNFLRRQTDANNSSSHSKSNSTSSGSELERPLSEYDNIKPTTNQTHFPLGDIKFRFDDLPLATKTIMKDSTSSAVHYNNKNDKSTIT